MCPSFRTAPPFLSEKHRKNNTTCGFCNMKCCFPNGVIFFKIDCPHLLSHAWTLCFHSLNSNRRIRTMTGSVCCQPTPLSAKEMNAIQRKFRALVRLLCICRCRHAAINSAKPNKSKTNRLVFAFYICPPWRLSPLFAPLF